MPALQVTQFAITLSLSDENLETASDEFFHSFDPTALDLPAHRDEVYACWSVEVYASGELHLHALICLSRKTTFANIRSLFDNHGWPSIGLVEKPRDLDSWQEYVCKGDDTLFAGPWERGSFERCGQGKRNDLADAVATLRDTRSIRATAMAHPTTFVRCFKGLERLQEVCGYKKKVDDSSFQPRPWQARLLRKLEQLANDRDIIWVHDSVGNRGKSRLARYLTLEKGAVLCEGKWTDMAYLVPEDGASIFIFDIPRDGFDKCKHYFAFAEKLKDRLLTSGKYQPVQKSWDYNSHVIFFSNTFCPPDVFSADRLKLIDLDNDVWHAPFPSPTDPRDEPESPPRPAGPIGAYGSGLASPPGSVASPPSAVPRTVWSDVSRFL